MVIPDRILTILFVALVAMLPFELRSFPVISNLQWLFVGVAAASLPILVRNRERLRKERLLQMAFVFVATQWIAALMAPEFSQNAQLGAVRVTAGFLLLCAATCVQDHRTVIRAWSLTAVVAAIYAILDHNGFGLSGLFRADDYRFSNIVRLSGSFEYPNTAAAFFGLSLPLVSMAATSRVFRIAGSLVIWVALILTYSRGAVLAVLTMLVIWGLVVRSKSAIAVGTLCIATFGGVVFVQPVLFQRFLGPPPAGEFVAEYQPEFNLLKRRPNEEVELSVRIRNAGTSSWRATSEDPPFRLSYRWYDPVGKRLVQGARGDYVPIPLPIDPNQSVTMHATVLTPGNPGLYLLTWDISRPGRNWLSAHGVFPGLVEAEIQPGSEIWSGNTDLSRWHGSETSRMFVVNRPVSRPDLWRVALDVSRESPLFGTGPDNFRLIYSQRLGTSRPDPNIRSNSLYLELLSGSGLPGLAAFIAMIASIKRVSLAPVLAIGVFLIHGLVDVFLMTTPIYFAFWILLGFAQRETGLEPTSGLAKAEPAS